MSWRYTDIKSRNFVRRCRITTIRFSEIRDGVASGTVGDGDDRDASNSLEEEEEAFEMPFMTADVLKNETMGL